MSDPYEDSICVKQSSLESKIMFSMDSMFFTLGHLKYLVSTQDPDKLKRNSINPPPNPEIPSLVSSSFRKTVVRKCLLLSVILISTTSSESTFTKQFPLNVIDLSTSSKIELV